MIQWIFIYIIRTATKAYTLDSTKTLISGTLYSVALLKGCHGMQLQNDIYRKSYNFGCLIAKKPFLPDNLQVEEVKLFLTTDTRLAAWTHFSHADPMLYFIDFKPNIVPVGITNVTFITFRLLKVGNTDWKTIKLRL